MRVFITGAGGVIGKRMITKLLDMFGNEVEFLIAQDREDVHPLFQDLTDRVWIRKNLEDAEVDDWNDWIIDNNIDTIFYIECLENLNTFYSTTDINTRLAASDNVFMEFLTSIYTIEDKIKVCYLSTDKVYRHDEFPTETHSLIIQQPQGLLEDQDLELLSYVNSKISTETRLLAVDHIEKRIIRPFGIVAPEQETDFPLTSVILKAMYDVDLEIYQKGDQGLAFTHVQDLADFLLSPRLFDPNIRLVLSSDIINFSRVWNYLSEYLLFKKLREKLDSKSMFIPETEINYFNDIMRTPQIRNGIKIYIPRITIEEIIEEIAETRNIENTYQPLVVQQVYYTSGPILHINGTAEPFSMITVYLGTGESLSTDANENGIWEVVTEEPYNSTGGYDAEIRATSQEGIQYQTERAMVPSAEDWVPPEYVDLKVNILRFNWTTGSDPKPYFEMAGIFTPLGKIKVELPAGSSTTAGRIYLEGDVDEHGNWALESLPGLYIMEEGYEGVIKAFLPDETPYSTFVFDVPVSGTEPVIPPPPVYSILEVNDVRYRNETEGAYRQYLYMQGIAEPNAEVIVRIPGSSGTSENMQELVAFADLNGNWELNSHIPYYMVFENMKGYAHGFMNGDIYAVREFPVEVSPEAPPPPPPGYPFAIESVGYEYDQVGRAYLTLSGTGPDDGIVKITAKDLVVEVNIFENRWWFKTIDPFVNYDLNEYGKVELFVYEQKKDEISFLLPPSPTLPPQPQDGEIIIQTVQHKVDGVFQPENNYMSITGKSKPLSDIRVVIPPCDGQVDPIELQAQCDAEGNFSCSTYKGYTPNVPNTCGCSAYSVGCQKFSSCSFSAPSCPFASVPSMPGLPNIPSL